MTSFHLHVMLSVKLFLTVNWENSKNLILLNSASFFKNLMCFNVFITFCKAELTCWHHIVISCSALLADTVLLSCALLSVRADLLTLYCYLCSALLADIILLSHALLSVKQSWLAGIVLLFVLCKAELCWHHTADLLTSYCHLVSCSACWHCTAISRSALCQAELTCWHCTATSCALLCLLTSYCQISMFHSWTSYEEIQEDQLC